MKTAAALVVVALLVACGGTDSEPQPTPKDQPDVAASITITATQVTCAGADWVDPPELPVVGALVMRNCTWSCASLGGKKYTRLELFFWRTSGDEPWQQLTSPDSLEGLCY